MDRARLPSHEKRQPHGAGLAPWTFMSPTDSDKAVAVAILCARHAAEAIVRVDLARAAGAPYDGAIKQCRNESFIRLAAAAEAQGSNYCARCAARDWPSTRTWTGAALQKMTRPGWGIATACA